MTQASFATHEVLNQSPPFEDVDLFTLDQPLAEPAGYRHGPARFCELRQGMVALFRAERSRTRI